MAGLAALAYREIPTYFFTGSDTLTIIESARSSSLADLWLFMALQHHPGPGTSRLAP